MRTRLSRTACLPIALLLLLGSPGPALAGAEPASTAEKPEPLPGVQLATAMATATGIAITPLLGVSTVGAWQYLRAGDGVREALPWYASPWFWVPGLAVALLLVFKDPVLGWMPGVKKPLDALDVVENKASAVLAAPAVVPMFLAALGTARAASVATRGGLEGVSLAGLGGAAAVVGELPGAIGLAVGAVVFLAAFFCIWLAFHAINVLILLSPFGFLDMFLRSIKFVVLAVLVGATLIHPYLGLAVALAILLASIPIAAWSYRLMVFGGVLAFDLFTIRHRRKSPAGRAVRAFTAGRLGGARMRTYGTVSAAGGRLSFTHRPWLVLGRRTVELPAGHYYVGRGLMGPMIRLREEAERSIVILRLPPRYRGHEEWLAPELELDGVEDAPFRRGLRAAVEWLKEMAGRGSREVARLAGQVGEAARLP